MPEEPTRGYTLDELSRALANGSISRGRALKLLAAMAVAAVVPARLAAAKPKKVYICHKPGTPAEKTLYVPKSAVEGHLGHGDYKGKCKKKTTTTTPKHTTTTTPKHTTTTTPKHTTTTTPKHTTTTTPKY